MEKKLDEINRKVDTVITVNNKQNIKLERLSVLTEQNTEILDNHIKRTEQNELRLNHMEKLIESHLFFIEKSIKLGAWASGFIITIIGIIISLKRSNLI